MNLSSVKKSGRWGPYRQASPPPARHRLAHGLRAERAVAILSQTTPAEETTMWLKNFFGARKPDPARARVRPTQRENVRQPATCRLAVESLDDRFVPAALSVSDALVVEGAGTTQLAVVSVSLNAPSNKTVSVNYATANGTATAGHDYEAVSGKLIFAPGETGKTIIIPISSDSQIEGSETFSLNLKSAKNAKIADGRGIVTIVDDRPSVRVSDEQAYPGTTILGFTVSLSAPYDHPVTVNYATADVTAFAGEDYVAASGTLTFAPGEITKSFAVNLLGDTTVGSSQEFLVNLNVEYADGRSIDTWGYGIIWNADGYGDGSGGESYDGGWW
jgi:hypothetical protein